MKIRDSCHDEMTVYKEALMAAVEQDCSSYYDLGVLVPEEYRKVLEPVERFSLVPISYYGDQNFEKPLVNVMVNFLSTKYEAVDLFITSSEEVLDNFLEISREAGICLRSYMSAGLKNFSGNSSQLVIAVAGSENEVKIWIEDGEKMIGLEITWVVLLLDGSRVDGE